MNRNKDDFVFKHVCLSGYIQDNKLIRNIDRVYSSSEIIETARRVWNKQHKFGRSVDSLIINLYPRNIYTLLQKGTQSDKDFFRWRLYRGSDIAEELGIPKIVLPFPSQNGMYDMDICCSLFCFLYEILQYDLHSVYIVAVNTNISTFDFFYKDHVFDISHRILLSHLSILFKGKSS